MSRKRAKNLTLHTRVLAMARIVMKKRGIDSLTAFIEELIRVEYERRCGLVKVPPLLDSVSTTADDQLEDASQGILNTPNTV